MFKKGLQIFYLVNSELRSPDDFKPLSSKSRITILKLLNKRKYTLSELSKILGLSKSTVFHHLKILEEFGYVTRVEDGRKWVYYSLTERGKSVIKWKRIRIILSATGVVASSIAAIVGIVMISLREQGIQTKDNLLWMAILVLGILVSIGSLMALIYNLKN